MSAATHDTRRAALVERCQQERNELIGLRATAVALAPRARAWVRAARALLRIARIFITHPQHASRGN
jgi:hypothetical protein